ncbi:alkene reductase [Hymenobacter terrenus]|uniref:alkene reductase n=1 Tax=Hymenobacter terrenus TaxID=1629124 RepID=UPI000619E94E|nr:alkene reductase [Hymenobacter terrenus]
MKLLTPFELAAFSIPNRVVMAPMTRSRATPDGVVGDMTVTYYQQRASMGLLISEAINISAQAIGSPLTPGLYTAAHVAAWRTVTDAVHAAGGRIFAQLWHTGRVGHSLVRGGEVPVAPSAVRIEGQQHFTPSGMQEYEVPRALTTEEVAAVVEDYRQAAEKAHAAGFDGVELHAAFGYLPNQFLVAGANHRTDAYGGSIANRCRFVLDVMRALVEVWGPARVGIKLSPSIPFNGMVDSDPQALYTYLIQELNTLPLAYLHLMRPLFPLDAFPHWPTDILATFGGLFDKPIIANGGYTREAAEQEIDSGRAQLVSFGALALANPDLPARFARQAAFNEPDRATFYGGGSQGYIDYPAL